MIDIIIPTNKYHWQLKRQIGSIKRTTDMLRYNVIPTCLQASAATNRNHGLIVAKSEIVIMMDDDITGFFKGWADKLIQPLEDDPTVIMVSARLMDTPKRPGVMMDIPCDMSEPLYKVKNFYDVKDVDAGVTIGVKAVPSACVAFRRDGIMFDEAYIGAGFEDTDFGFQKCCKHPKGEIVINNECPLIHKNEMKNQMEGQLQRNQLYFKFKWGLQ